MWPSRFPEVSANKVRSTLKGQASYCFAPNRSQRDGTVLHGRLERTLSSTTAFRPRIMAAKPSGPETDLQIDFGSGQTLNYVHLVPD